MAETQFCYWCRKYHPREEMRLFMTKPGPRWRCLRSIAAAAAPQTEREHFGHQQSRVNSEAARRAAVDAIRRKQAAHRHESI